MIDILPEARRTATVRSWTINRICIMNNYVLINEIYPFIMKR